MNIQLGNLELKDVVDKKYLEKIQKFLDENGYQRECKCDDIKHRRGNYHIFDIPRLITICGKEKMSDFIAFLQKEVFLEKAFKGSIGVTYVDEVSEL